MPLKLQVAQDEKGVITSVLNNRQLLVSLFPFLACGHKISTPLGCYEDRMK